MTHMEKLVLNKAVAEVVVVAIHLQISEDLAASEDSEVVVDGAGKVSHLLRLTTFLSNSLVEEIPLKTSLTMILWEGVASVNKKDLEINRNKSNKEEIHSVAWALEEVSLMMTTMASVYSEEVSEEEAACSSRCKWVEVWEEEVSNPSNLRLFQVEDLHNQRLQGHILRMVKG